MDWFTHYTGNKSSQIQVARTSLSTVKWDFFAVVKNFHFKTHTDMLGILMLCLYLDTPILGTHLAVC